jgi:phage terminase large subunit-like protein
MDPQSKTVNHDRLLADNKACELLLEKANPMWGISLNPDTIKEDRATAKRRPDKRGEFLRTRYNIWISSGTNLVEPAAWAACKRDIRIEDFVGLPCWIAVDLAQYNDMCAVIALFERGDEVIAVFPKFFIPEEAPLVSDPEYGDTVWAWGQDGHLEITEGPSADFDKVQEHIEALVEVLKPRHVVFDPYQAAALVDRLYKAGVSVGTFPNNAKTMTAPTDDLLSRISLQTIIHDGNPVLAWNAQNVQGERKGNGSIMPRRDESNRHRKVDGFIALAMCNGVRVHPDYAVVKDKDAPIVSPYETGRLVSPYE